MKPYKPYYCKEPNKLLRYEFREKVCQVGHRYVERVAVYLNKDKVQCEGSAQIIWK